MKRRIPKRNDVLELARKLFAKGAYVVSSHAKLRQNERNFSIGDIEGILSNGHYEPRKDEYKEEHDDWNYAIRGHSLDGERARLCIAFDRESLVIIITVIRLERN